jgi:hypothetical protein
MSSEEVKMFRKFKKEEQQDPEQNDKDTQKKLDEKKFFEINKKIDDQQVISRDEFKFYEKYLQFEEYTKDFYYFKCPKCSDSYDVIVRGNTANEKISRILYVEDEKIEQK